MKTVDSIDEDVFVTMNNLSLLVQILNEKNMQNHI